MTMEDFEKWINFVSTTLQTQQRQIDGMLQVHQQYLELLRGVVEEIKTLKNKETQIGLSQVTKKEQK